jgi:hypothetical protein
VSSSPSSPRPRRSGAGTDTNSERRQNVALRELLDEMIQISRHLANRAATLPESELTYARKRLEWLADEIWRHVTGEAAR